MLFSSKILQIKMSLSLFNAISAGSIEILSDAKGAPYFKRADLGRFLGVKCVAEMYRNIDTASRKKNPEEHWFETNPPPRSKRSRCLP